MKFNIWHCHRIAGSFTCEGTLRCPQSKLVYKQDQLWDQTRLFRDFLKQIMRNSGNGDCSTSLGKSVPLSDFPHCGKTLFRPCPLSVLVPLAQFMLLCEKHSLAQLCEKHSSPFSPLRCFWSHFYSWLDKSLFPNLSSWISEQFSLSQEEKIS